MSFINPIAFWGLLSLLIPLIIHLLSKRQKHEVYFGSTRFLSEQETTSARSFQLSDLMLLLLRLLIIASLIAAIAQMVITDDSMETIYYVEYELVENEDYAKILPNENSNQQVQYFSYDQSIDDETIETYPSAFTLINQLNSLNDSISVFTFSEEQFFKGTNQKLNQLIDWNIIPKKETTTASEYADTPISINILSSSTSTSYKNELLTVINSIKEYLPFDLNPGTSKEWLVTIDTIVNSDTENIINWETNHTNFSFSKEMDIYKMSGSLSKKSMLESNFPLLLSQALINSRIVDNSKRNKIYEPSYIDSSENDILKAEAPTNYKSLSNYFWIFLMLILLVERYFSLRLSKS